MQLMKLDTATLASQSGLSGGDGYLACLPKQQLLNMTSGILAALNVLSVRSAPVAK